MTVAGPRKPKRFMGFVSFFKAYMNLWTVITASLPIPITQLHWIPTFSAQTAFLSTYTSLFCFLLVAFVFYTRHFIARWLFRDYLRRTGVQRSKPWLPLLLILAAVVLVFCYHTVLLYSIGDVYLSQYQNNGVRLNTKEILEKTDLREIPYSNELALIYLAMFLCAEGAFVVMALREYLQDLLGIEELDLIEQQPDANSSEPSTSER
jgi:hypothetical protein